VANRADGTSGVVVDRPGAAHRGWMAWTQCFAQPAQ
jgi:hypothetical protein